MKIDNIFSLIFISKEQVYMEISFWKYNYVYDFQV